MRYHEIVESKYDIAKFDAKDLKIKQEDDFFTAYWRGKKIGTASIDSDDRRLACRHIWKSFVKPEFRRKGVATALYDAIDAALEEKGLRLVPTEGALSDDAYNFWKKRNPEAVKHDARRYAANYIGKTFPYKGQDWRIRSINDRSAWIESPDGPATSTVNSQEVFDLYGAPPTVED